MMTSNRIDTRPYYIAHGERFSYVRGLQDAYQRLAEYLNTTGDDVRKNRRRYAGLIQRVSAAEGRAAGL